MMRVVFALLFLAVAGYAYYETRGLIFGPRIELPTEIVHSADRFFLIKGKAERIASLKMNGAAIAVTEDGSFEEPYILAPGLNRIFFDAEDKYGNTSQEVLQVFYSGRRPELPGPSSPPLGTTTPQSATSSDR
jgi:uncharacterized protein YfaP (DUF2135 family)